LTREEYVESTELVKKRKGQAKWSKVKVANTHPAAVAVDQTKNIAEARISRLLVNASLESVLSHSSSFPLIDEMEVQEGKM
jgi:hypothetical protein